MKDRLKYLFLYLRELDKDQGEELRIRKNIDTRIDFVLHQIEYDINSTITNKRALYEWSYIFDKQIAGMSHSHI